MAQDLLNKYIWLATTIYQAKRITLKEINNKWLRSCQSNNRSIALRTFHNHKAAIQTMFDITIKCDVITNEYYIENQEDFAGKHLSTWLLNSFAIRDIVRESSDIRERVVLDEAPSAEKFLTLFLTAMRKNKVVQAHYQSFEKEQGFEISLHPYFVKLFNKRWYVYARTERDATVKVYALDRIKSAELTAKSFTLPVQFSAAEHLHSSIGIMKTPTDLPCEIIIKAFRNTPKYLRELPMHHSQTEIETTSEYSLFKYWLAPTEDFYQEILRKREYIEVVSPALVRDKLGMIVRKLAGFYL